MADIALQPRVAKRQIREATAWDQLRTNRNWLGFWFMLPAMAFLIFFLAYPLGLGIWMSFTDAKIGRPGEFIGTENYEWLWGDSIFWLSVFNTLLYTTIASAIKFAVGLYLALLLNENMPFKAMLRALVLIPFIVPTVLSALAFWWIFDSQFSIISWSLKHLGLITQNINFLGDVTWARICVIFVNIWRGVPFVAITLLAGLQTVQPSLYEADVFGAVHLHRLPADLGDDPRRTGQRHPSDGDLVVSARHHRRPTRRGRRDLERDDPVPARRDHDFLVRAAAPQVAARGIQ